MKYLYYPGCSAKSSGRSYEESLLAVFKKLNVPLEEIEDWNCCGATNYMSINESSAISLIARNLAIAEKMGGADIIAPCAACYMGLLKTKNYLDTDEKIKAKVLEELTKIGMPFSNKVNVRHPLDVLINDIGLKTVETAIFEPLKGLKVACYYGCQLIRPINTFDDQRDPHTMDDIVKTLGAESVDWPLKTRCCSGSMTSTISDIGMRMNFLLLKEAKFRGADVIITSCPLCQFNLECFQGKVSKMFGEDVKIPVMYFTQLMGMAFGINEKELGLHRMLSPSLSLVK
jgi:heterodisulfide reductase subunit B2